MAKLNIEEWVKEKLSNICTTPYLNDKLPIIIKVDKKNVKKLGGISDTPFYVITEISSKDGQKCSLEEYRQVENASEIEETLICIKGDIFNYLINIKKFCDFISKNNLELLYLNEKICLSEISYKERLNIKSFLSDLENLKVIRINIGLKDEEIEYRIIDGFKNLRYVERLNENEIEHKKNAENFDLIGILEQRKMFIDYLLNKNYENKLYEIGNIVKDPRQLNLLELAFN